MALKVGGDALHLPIAVANRFWAFAATRFGRSGAIFSLCGGFAARLGFGESTLCGLCQRGLRRCGGVVAHARQVALWRRLFNGRSWMTPV